MRAFLDDAQDDESVTWEAKADDDDQRRRPEGEEPGRLHPRTLHKAASAFANQIGGYLILGARCDKEQRQWRLSGFVSPEPEVKTWLDNVLSNLRPAPRSDTKAWNIDGDRWVAVVQVPPVDEPPCMTPLGLVYERVSGKSERVTDPTLLERLFRRGREQRAETELFAHNAAMSSLNAPQWEPTWSVTAAIAIAPLGRLTGDITTRLFSPSFREALADSLWRILPHFDHPTDMRVIPQQHAFGTGAFFSPARGNWQVRALWAYTTGGVAASATFSRATSDGLDVIADVALPGSREVVRLVERLGGYGPAHLMFVVRRAPHPRGQNPDGSFTDPSAQPQPPRTSSFFGRLPADEGTLMRRWIELEEPSMETLESLDRELKRAAGFMSLEPESDGERPD